MTTPYYRFTLSRPGLKAGYEVPVRLRFVDTATIFSGVPVVTGSIAFSMISLSRANQLGLGVIWQNVFALYVYSAIVLLSVTWITWLLLIAILRFVFQITGMLTKEESHFYPLRTDKRSIDPWPDSWQYPCVSTSKVSNDLETIESLKIRNNW